MTTPLPSPLLAGPGAGVPDAPAAALDEWFDVGALRRNRRYRRGTWAIGSAGMLTGAAWTVAVALSGNAAGLSQAELAALSPSQRDALRVSAAQSLASANADYTIDSVADLIPVLDDIERRLATGARPIPV